MWEQVKQALNQSFERVIAGLANLLPGLAALVVALVFSALAAWVLAGLLRRFLRGINFDKRCAAWGLSGLAEWSPGKSPSLLVTRSVSWLVVLVGFLIGIAAFDAAITSELALSVFRYLPNVVAASGLFLVGNVLARFLARGVLIGAVNHNLQYARLLSLGVKWLVLVLAGARASGPPGRAANTRGAPPTPWRRWPSPPAVRPGADACPSGRALAISAPR